MANYKRNLQKEIAGKENKEVFEGLKRDEELEGEKIAAHNRKMAELEAIKNLEK